MTGNLTLNGHPAWHVVGGPAAVAGYSFGGVVALATALRRPDLVRRLILINTAASREGWLVHPDPDGEFPAVVVDAYADVSPDGRHLLLWERPDEAAALVGEFLTRAPNRMMPIRFSVPAG